MRNVDKSVGRYFWMLFLAICMMAGSVAFGETNTVYTREVGNWNIPFSGIAEDTFVVGNRAYVACGSGGLRIYDVTTPTNAALLGGYDTPGNANGVYVSGDYAYVADGEMGGLQIIDVSDPANSVLVGNYNDYNGYMQNVYVSGNYAYVADGNNGLEIIDVSDPANPGLVGHYNGYMQDVFVSGNYAYMADRGSGLQIIDVSNPVSPTLVGSYDTSGYARGVYVRGNYAYVADESSGLQIIEVSNPSSPTLVGSYDTSNYAYAYGVHVSGNYAYMVDGNSGLQIIDVSNPSAPALAGNYNTSGFAHGVYIAGNYAYVADFYGGFKIINVSDSSNPILSGNYNTYASAEDVYVMDNYAYVANGGFGLQVFDISKPEYPVLMGSCDMLNAHGVCICDDYAYVADDGGLQIIDINDPNNPICVGHNPWLYANDVSVISNYAYVTYQSGSSLMVFDVSISSNPVELGSCHISGAQSVFVCQSNAYVASGSSGVKFVDICVPTNPVVVGEFVGTNYPYAYDVFVSKNIAYIAGSSDGLQIVDVTDFSNPVLLNDGSISAWGAEGITINHEMLAYIACSGLGLKIVDVSDSKNPVLVGECNTYNYVYNACATNNYVYIADGRNGLGIIRVSTNPPPSVTDAYPAETNLEISVGGGREFSVSAVSSNGTSIYYDWRLNGASIGSAATCSVSTAGASVGDQWDLVCYVSDADWTNGASQSWTITIMPPPPEITTANLPEGIEMEAYSAQLCATNGTPPYSWNSATNDYVESAGSGSSFEAIGAFTGWQDIYGSWELELPFEFPFYDQYYSNLYVNGAGTVSFGWSMGRYGSFIYYKCVANFMYANIQYSEPDDGVYIAASTNSVTIRWKGRTSSSLDSMYDWNSSVTLYPDGRIVNRYGEGNWDGYPTVGVSDGSGNNYIYSSESRYEMDRANDIVFTPEYELPDGLSITADGVLNGKPLCTGSFTPTFIVTDADQVMAIKNIPLVIVTNSNQRPVIDSFSPTNAQYAMYAAYTQEFSVVAHDPEGANLTYRWLRDGVLVSTAESYNAQTAWTNSGDSWSLRCWVADDLWTNHVYQDWSVTVKTDNDNDGMPNLYETNYPGVLNPWGADGTNDYDSDFADNLTEYRNGTCPTNRDTNGDNLSDGWQIRYGSDPLSSTGGIAGLDLQRVGWLDLPGYYAYGVEIVEGYAYMAASYSGLQIIDVKNSTNPVFVSECDTPDSAHCIDVSGNYAYLADNSSGLQVIDVSIVTNPVVIGYCETPGYAYGVEVNGNYAYVASRYSGLQVIDVSDPTAPNVIGICGGPWVANDVFVSGNYAYVASDSSGMWIIDISNVTNPVSVGNCNTPGYAQHIYMSSNYAYVTTGSSSDMQIIDVSDVTNPVCVGSFRTSGGTYGIDMSGECAYLAAYSSGLQVVDVSCVTNSVSAGGCNIGGYAYGVTVDGNYVYVTDGYKGLNIICNNGLADTDQDGMLDSWEMANFSNLNQTATGDFDGDGIWNIGEYHGSLNPTEVDEDGDGLNDGNEVDAYNSSPLWMDSDYDSISDSNEVNGTMGKVTRPDLSDTDGDGTADYMEYDLLRDPTNPDDGGPVATISGMILSSDMALDNVVITLHGELSPRTYNYAYSGSDGVYELTSVVPGSYLMKVSVDGYADEWYPGVNCKTSAVSYVVAAGSTNKNVDFDLEPGQSPVLAYVSSIPSNAAIYLDFQPTGLMTPALIDVGESRSWSSRGVLRHSVTVSKQGYARQTPRTTGGTEADVWDCDFDWTDVSVGAISVTTQPSALVYLDVADTAVGTTPVTITNVEIGTHTLLLQPAGSVLRPRPVTVTVSQDCTTVISLALETNLLVQDAADIRSVPPGAEVFVDYLPPAQTSPIRVDQLDPASHAGIGWHSASHCVLLRKDGYKKACPRAVPEGTTGTVNIVLIDEPSEMTFDDGYDMPDQWVDSYGWTNLPPESQDERNGDDDADGDGINNADEFLAGTDPTDKGSAFEVGNGTGVQDDQQQKGVRMVFATVPGMKYMVMKTAALDQEWENISGVITATSETTIFNCPIEDYDDSAFYRIMVIPVGFLPEPSRALEIRNLGD